MWILIMALSLGSMGDAVSISTAEFTSLKNCEYAASKFKKIDIDSRLIRTTTSVVCVPK